VDGFFLHLDARESSDPALGEPCADLRELGADAVHEEAVEDREAFHVVNMAILHAFSRDPDRTVAARGGTLTRRITSDARLSIPGLGPCVDSSI
jgi:hypothetical protein